MDEIIARVTKLEWVVDQLTKGFNKMEEKFDSVVDAIEKLKNNCYGSGLKPLCQSEVATAIAESFKNHSKEALDREDRLFKRITIVMSVVTFLGFLASRFL
jgi:hypothetical protein